MQEDSFFILRASKESTSEHFYYNTVFPVLVKPNTNVSVKAAPPVVKTGSKTSIVVSNTQQGVSYQLFKGNKEIGPPGYHYQDRSIDTMRSEIDFLVVEKNDRYVMPDEHPELTDVVLPSSLISAQTEFSIRAIKNKTGIYSDLNTKAIVNIEQAEEENNKDENNQEGSAPENNEV